MPSRGEDETISRAEQSPGVEHYRRQFETVCNNATLALFIMDERQHCTYMNPAAEMLTGYRLAEVRGRALHDAIHHTRPDGTPYPMAECPIDRALPENNQEQGEDVFVHRDGHFYPVAYTASPVREKGQLVGTVIEVRDITRERQIEQQREDNLRRMCELDRAKTAFFSSVSHELRTPLMLMLAAAEEALEDHALSAAQRDRWSLLRRNGRRLLKLVNTLLDFARIEAGRVQIRYEPTDLAAFTRELSALFSSAMARAGLRFEVDCPPLAEPVFVDREMWEKIVINLLSNALKFTTAGAVSVALRRRGDGVELSVRDTGCGVPEDELPRIFERFYRVHVGHARTHEGTGIGLALVKELVEMHGGRVTAESCLGAGTTFTVTIPAGSAHLAPERIAAPEALAPSPRAALYVEEALRWSPEGAEGGAESDGGAAPGPIPDRATQQRVLVVDDNVDVRRYLTRILRARWTVETATDGMAALEAIQARRPDLVLSDVMMPRLDGLGLVRRLRADPATRTLPIVLVSARAGEQETSAGLRAGANDYIVKPFGARELAVRVAAQLEIARIRDEAEAAAQAAQAWAEEANRAKDEFLALLGHELRNPLAPILTALQLMKMKGGDTFARERSIIERQTTHLVRLVDDLLDVSRVIRGKIQLQREPIELDGVVAKAIETASPLIEQRRHRLEVDVPRPLVVHADPTRLAQVVANLLTNAAKYTDPGGRIQIRSCRDGNAVVLCVEDNGIGIPAQLLPHLFDMFVQAPQSLDRSQGGLGLGLALVRSLVSLHGGTVGAQSDGPGKGSTFTVHLPLLQASSPPPVATTARASALAGAGRHLVLIVDDNQDAADTLADALTALGHAVRVAYDAPTAIAAARELRPEVALLDIGLPVMSGYELRQRIHDELPDTRFVAISGYGQASDHEQSRAAGFARHVNKPVDVHTVHALLGELMREKQP
jgi:PAS domain S-box-containing protein